MLETVWVKIGLGKNATWKEKGNRIRNNILSEHKEKKPTKHIRKEKNKNSRQTSNSNNKGTITGKKIKEK